MIFGPCPVTEYLKPIAAEERKIEEAEKAAREEQERIAKQLAEGKHSLTHQVEHMFTTR